MCGFYSRDEIGVDDFKKLYRVEEVDGNLIAARYNIRPGTVNPVITRNSPNKAEPMLWHFHPGWPNLPFSRGVINARIESLKEGKAYYRSSFKSKRCLIPSSHWVEWVDTGGGKIPHLFSLKSRKYFSFAGLWNEFTDNKGTQIKGYAIVTGEPNPLASKIHSRMPCVLRQEDEDTWIDPEERDVITLLKCLEVYPEKDMEVFAIGRDLSINSPVILKPLSREELDSAMQKKPKEEKSKKSKVSKNQQSLL